MGLITPPGNKSWDNVPDVIVPIPTGVYTLKVEEAELGPTKDGKSERVAMVMAVDEPDSEHHERKVWDFISIKMLTKLKRLAKSAGKNPEQDGIDTDELVGCHVKARVLNKTYVDEDSGETKESNDVQDYLIPGDDGYGED